MHVPAAQGDTLRSMDKLITIRQCDLAELWSRPNIDALLSQYARESAIDGLPEPKPDREVYAALEACGALTLVCAFRGDELIGLIAMVVTRNPHYSQLIAVVESFFVSSDARYTGAGLRLLQEAEFLARAREAVGMFISAPVGSRLERVLPGKGFRETNRAFFRGLQ